MWKRYLLGLILFITAGILSLPFWFSPKQAEQLANHFLAPNYQIQLKEQWQFNLKGLVLPTFKLHTSQCTLIELDNANLSWWGGLELKIAHANLDYACLTQLPQNEHEEISFNLTTLWNFLPNSGLEISQFKLVNIESLTNGYLRQLINQPIFLSFNYNGDKLETLIHAKDDKSAVILQQHSWLTLKADNVEWQGIFDYQPELQKNYHLQFYTQFDPSLTHFPSKGAFHIDWQNSDFSVNKGHLDFTWDGEKGQINAQDLQRNQPLLEVPLSFSQKGISVNWGKLFWTFDGYQPIRGFFGIELKKTEEHWLPLKTDFNVILQTFGEFGKGEIVLSTKDGVIGSGEHRDRLQLSLITRGDLRYNHNVAQTNLNYQINGTFVEPYLTFGKGSVFKMDNVQDDSKIHLRLPMDDIIISKYGLEGRLQASLQGDTPQLEQLNLKLDGQAHEFIAGIKTVFELRDENQRLRSAEGRAANRWDWNVQGTTILKALKTPVQLNGIGFWRGDHIELNQLKANSGEVNIEGVKIAPISLELKDRLRWNYEKEHIRGLAQAKTEWIEFGYGGRFEQPVLGVGIDGKSINHFTVAGDLSASALGPLDIRARYENTRLNGKIAWKAQSATVFQSLFPQDWDWAIHRGSIEGATDFSIDEKGIRINGKLRLKDGEISFPDGEIQGLNIEFPLHYQNYSLQAKRQNPITVFAQHLRIGALDIQQTKFNAYGHYPYSVTQPFSISQVKMGIFDGNLNLPYLSIPQQKMAVIELQHIEMERVLALAQYNQINMQGRINARLPFWIKHETCLICDGSISNSEYLNIRMNELVVSSLRTAGLTEKMLVELVKNMKLTEFDANVNLRPDGNMNLMAVIAGYNPEYKTYNPIRLNYTHKENMFELWRMIDYGSQFEQNLEYRLYQRSKK